MNALVLLLIPATIGVDFGWERQPDNSIEYILQIEPEAVDSMKTGTELRSSLPPALRNISDYRLRVGRDRLPNQNIIPPEFNTAAQPAQPNINSGNYAAAGNYPPAGNYPSKADPYGTTTNYTAANNGYPPNNGNNTGFVNNNSAPPVYTQPGTQYAQPGTLANPNNGLSPIGTAQNGPQTMPTSTSNWPINTTNATYPTNNNQTLANLPPPPQGNYPNNAYPNNSYATNPYGAAPQSPNYVPAGYNGASYANNPYNALNYQQPYPNQPYQQQPVNPYGQQPPYNLAMNPNGPLLPSGYSDPRSAAKPSLNDPATSGFPPGTQFNQPGAAPSGSAPLNPFPPNGSTPGTMPPGGFTANNNAAAPFVTTGATNVDPQHNAALGANQATAKEQPQSQWASLSFALVALFASIGANIYVGWQNHYLRERCRMLVTDRAAY